MPEENNNLTNTPPASPAKPAEGSSQTIDFANLTDEQLEKVYENPNLYKHPRFKDLSDAKKERDELRAKEKKVEEERLRSQGEFQKLAEAKEKENTELKQQLQSTKIDSAIEKAAAKLGAVDPEAVLKLVNRTSIRVDETGEISGVTEAVDTLIKEKPYLVNGPAPKLGTASNPANEGTGNIKRFKLSQIQNASFYQANKADIEASMRAGMVEDDLH